MRVPRSTYRLQITPTWTLFDAAALVPQLAALGADWVYLSPILESDEGSDHGYDVTDHGSDRHGARRPGGRWPAVADAAHAAGMGVLVDIVPNHVGVATPARSTWWWELLRDGPESEHAGAFDVDWAAGGGRIRLPVLGDAADELDRLQLVDDEIAYYDSRFPIAPGTAGGSAREVHDRQHYELVSFRRADAELNYRRFFAVSTLAGHPGRGSRRLRRLARRGRGVGGPGLGRRPAHRPPGRAGRPGRVSRRSRGADRSPLRGGGEDPGGRGDVPESWQCAGTSGYDALALVDRLFVDPARPGSGSTSSTRSCAAGLRVDWPAMTRATKRAVADGILRSEVLRLARLAARDPRCATTLSRSCWARSRCTGRICRRAGSSSTRRSRRARAHARPELTDTLRAVADRLLDVDSEVSRRFQQTSGMVMAKGVEDCAFYRWTRLTSLTEVGAEPAEFALAPERLPRAPAGPPAPGSRRA